MADTSDREFLEYKFKVLADKIEEVKEDVSLNRKEVKEELELNKNQAKAELLESRRLNDLAHDEIKEDIEEIAKSTRDLENKASKTATIVSLVVSGLLLFGRTLLLHLGIKV